MTQCEDGQNCQRSIDSAVAKFYLKTHRELFLNYPFSLLKLFPSWQNSLACHLEEKLQF